MNGIFAGPVIATNFGIPGRRQDPAFTMIDHSQAISDVARVQSSRNGRLAINIGVNKVGPCGLDNYSGQLDVANLKPVQPTC